MFESIRKNKVPSLEPKRSLINNDINLDDYDLLSVFAVIFISAMFLVSLKLLVTMGYI